MTGRTDFLGCPIDSTTLPETVERCVAWCRDDAPTRILITVNVAILMMMRKDPALRAACRAGDMIVPDGMPVVWASRLVGHPLAGRVAGVDLMQALLERGDRERLKVYFLGARQHVLDRLKALCATRYPGLIVAGARNGYFSEEEHEDVVRDIRESGADILFIGMPTPFKEVWAQRHRDALGVSLVLGVGGSFDVLAGFVRRAPLWMQRSGTEWLWRLLMEPRKMWRRYLVTNSQFFVALARELWRQRLTPH